MIFVIQHFRHWLPSVALVSALAAAAGCVQPYDLEIQQGNVVTEDMLRQLEQGMTQREVRFVLGSPLLVDPFQPNRWDYYYWREAHDDLGPEQRRITLYFDDDGRLQRMRGDIIAVSPGGGDGAAADEAQDDGAAASGEGMDEETVAQVAGEDGEAVTETAEPSGEEPGILRRWWQGIWD